MKFRFIGESTLLITTFILQIFWFAKAYKKEIK